MNSKYTLLSLCAEFDKIEVPIIQRDYAQGRETDEVKNIRNKFVNNFLVSSLLSNTPTELDFVYGSKFVEKNKDTEDKKVFIPLDGQQRLTTLFLLHYFLGLKERKLEQIKPILSKFTYETRPSAHDFCKQLLDFSRVSNITEIKKEIIDSLWFNLDWLKDSTVSGMLNMLDTFAKNEKLISYGENLVERITSSTNPIFSFYFTDLEEFGLTENLYIRMNARGKMLTDFENFKSEFFKIIAYDRDLLEEVKNKIEYEWVTNLWGYREKDSFVIDKPFMNLLRFVTLMLYFKDAEFRSSRPYESDFLNFELLSKLYSSQENLNFLIFVLDKLDSIPNADEKLLWGGLSLNDLLAKILSGSGETIEQLLVYTAFNYLFISDNRQSLDDYLRVVRNLVENTIDKSQREWPRLLASLNSLIDDKNVYDILSEESPKNTLLGFNTAQRAEEMLKARLIRTFPTAKNLIFSFEDNTNLKGNIASLLKISFVESLDAFNEKSLNVEEFTNSKFYELKEIFNAYEIISNDDFNPIWGNLLNTSLYLQTSYSRLDFQPDYRKHFAVMKLAKDFSKVYHDVSLDDYILSIQKDFVNALAKTYSDFSLIRNVKKQLYLYYIIHTQLANKDYSSFFKNNNYNFGWLKKENGFKSQFKDGIEGCVYFNNTNPIFQVYNQQFRYNLGLKEYNALDEEIIAYRKNKHTLNALKEWANN